jgi:hypothetical protein
MRPMKSVAWSENQCSTLSFEMRWCILFLPPVKGENEGDFWNV